MVVESDFPDGLFQAGRDDVPIFIPIGDLYRLDRGAQDTSIVFGSRCEKAGVCSSMRSVGDCFDKVMCESFLSTFECEFLDRRCFGTHKKPSWRSLDTWGDGINPHPFHSAISSNISSPINNERRTLNPKSAPSTKTG